ncbi:hypothetical protein NDU88_003453 [Pleurodeles waltl]|uniref:Uncharacterized protein n=1 Tax=Pleurodeles waltl TaxID=8319 RepID=A0AAV7NGQ5_PLEWA|nr:hypothetical protein NDU88_003453 [Pleurodeles waltl]
MLKNLAPYGPVINTCKQPSPRDPRPAEECGGIRPQSVRGAAGAGLVGPAAAAGTADSCSDASLPATPVPTGRRRRKADPPQPSWKQAAGNKVKRPCALKVQQGVQAVCRVGLEPAPPTKK